MSGTGKRQDRAFANWQWVLEGAKLHALQIAPAEGLLVFGGSLRAGCLPEARHGPFLSSLCRNDSGATMKMMR